MKRLSSRRVRRGLAGLRPPAAGHALFEGFIADLVPTVARFRKARDEAITGCFTAAQADAEGAFAVIATGQQEERAMRLPEGCVPIRLRCSRSVPRGING